MDVTACSCSYFHAIILYFREIILPPPAQPEPVNLFIGVYECSLCAEKFEEMMDLADHVKTHMTPLEEEEELKNAQIAEAARAQAIEREQMLLRELEEGNMILSIPVL